MMTGRHRGQRLGACTDCRGFWGEVPRGHRSIAQEIDLVEGRLSVTAGTCAVMGTASTMACIAETLGMSLPGTAAIPAVHADRLVAAEESGRAAVALIGTTRSVPSRDRSPRKSVENAFRVLMAIGGSTNAIVHLTADRGTLRHSPVLMTRLNELSDETPVLVDLKPVGDGYMEDFHAAGGMGALLRELKPLLHLDTIDVTGRERCAERLDEPIDWIDRRVIRPFDDPVSSKVGGLVALSGVARARRRDLQARRGDAGAVRIRRPRGRLRRASRISPKRIDDPALDVKRRRLPRAAEHRTAGRGHAGGRLPADPEEARAGRREGHGAHLRRSHVGHRVRLDRAARRARVRSRRSARPRFATAIASGCRSPGSASICWSTPDEVARRLADVHAAADPAARLQVALSPDGAAGRPAAATSTS